MTSIVLTTLNARYIHASFGLRYLQANLGALQADSVIREFTINDNLQDVLAAILSEAPQVVGFGVYIWNVDQTLRLIADLRQVAPDVIIVLGGPEVSYETETQPIVTLADYVITGEADLTFAEICRDRDGRPEPDADLRDTENVPLPPGIALPLPLGRERRMNRGEHVAGGRRAVHGGVHRVTGGVHEALRCGVRSYTKTSQEPAETGPVQ